MSDGTRAVDSDNVWTTLITNLSYLPGLLTLHYSLVVRAKSRYPLVALYTDAFPEEGLAALRARGIPHQRIEDSEEEEEEEENQYPNDPRFNDCWTKLAPFSLVQYSRIVQLDSDMLCLQNMDELFDLPLSSSPSSSSTSGSLSPDDTEDTGYIFAAGHACTCNPLSLPHYPPSWTPASCAFTAFHSSPDSAQTEGGNVGPLGYLNGGLTVVVPSLEHYRSILNYMHTNGKNLDFADQSLLSDLFKGQWMTLPYIYNALKTMRWKGVHDKIWRDGEVKCLHYILTPKPWEEEVDEKTGKIIGKGGRVDETHQWWVDINSERKKWEETKRVVRDGW
ncbi:nucleotide-diphospho-sugar transferase [Podospora australis]|uniref:Nucleotide-diphospho-sugar transferase n=1 Tax=Podospora australis TaxID=1536484 RepID=A0AAN6X0B0_9PEZI|nr:nucleotide-diphospho-sugar transferase [Podospora australis]